MRIAYSCAGEGFGHAARMVVLSRWLERRHEVTYCAPIEVHSFLTEKIPGFSVLSVPCLSFRKSRDRVDLFGSLLDNLPLVAAFPLTIRRLARQFKRMGIQAVISDFEPFAAWAAHLAGIPVFQMNHPGIVSRCMNHDPNSWAHALGAKIMEGPWNRRALISFYRGDIGPLFRPSLFRHPVTQGAHIVVNLKPSYRPPVVHILKSFPKLDIRMFPTPGADFEKELASCAAVISPAGHQIIAEALVLGKPILAMPQQGQWEQIVNAHMLEQTGRGMASSIESLPRDLPKFLERLDDFREAFKVPLPDGFTINDGSERLYHRIETFLAKADPRMLEVVRPNVTIRSPRLSDDSQFGNAARM